MRQVGDGAQHVEVAGERAVPVLDEADVLDAHPAGLAQGAGGLAGDAADADDERVGLVVAAAAQGADGRPGEAAGAQHQDEGRRPEQHHRRPRLVGVVAEEGGGQHQQGQQRHALEDADHFFAEPPQAVDGVLAGGVEGEGGQQQDQRQVGPEQGRVGLSLGDRNEGVEADVVGAAPGQEGHDEVADEEQRGQDLAAALEHDGPVRGERISIAHSSKERRRRASPTVGPVGPMSPIGPRRGPIPCCGGLRLPQCGVTRPRFIPLVVAADRSERRGSSPPVGRNPPGQARRLAHRSFLSGSADEGPTQHAAGRTPPGPA